MEKYDCGIVSPLYTCFTLKDKEKQGFLKFYFKSNKWHRFIYTNGDKGARGDRVSIKDDTFYSMPIMIPGFAESEKIVTLLSLVERKIELKRGKLEALKKYKKGLQKFIFYSNKNDKFELLKNSVIFEQKSNISAGSSIDDGKYILYKSGQKNGTLNTYTNEGIYIIANDGGEASFKLTNDKFSYTDHCICFKCDSDEKTITLANYLQLLEKKITYIGFTGTGLKNIDRQYLGMIKIPVLEYKKIAESFCKLDRAILNNEYKLECLSKLKKQLLQSMFI